MSDKNKRLRIEEKLAILDDIKTEFKPKFGVLLKNALENVLFNNNHKFMIQLESAIADDKNFVKNLKLWLRLHIPGIKTSPIASYDIVDEKIAKDNFIKLRSQKIFSDRLYQEIAELKIKRTSQLKILDKNKVIKQIENWLNTEKYKIIDMELTKTLESLMSELKSKL